MEDEAEEEDVAVADEVEEEVIAAEVREEERGVDVGVAEVVVVGGGVRPP